MYKKIFALLALFTFVIAGCDKLDDPYLEEKGGGVGPTPDENVRKVILEEFTGHLCPNCPEGSAVAHDLKTIYGEQLIMVSIHAGFFALPQGGLYTADYRTNTGADLNNYFNVQSYPAGMVNRTDFNGVIMGKDSWEAAIQDLLEMDAVAGLEIETSYEEATRSLDIVVHTSFLQNFDDAVNLSVIITESGIVSPQKNSNPAIGPSPDWEDYEHDHVLRTAVNGTWGDALNPEQSISQGDEFMNTYSVNLSENWDASNCHVVAYVYNTTNDEVLQAEETAVTE